MPGQNFSDKVGSSPSPVVERVIQNNKDVQQPFATPQAAIDNAWNRHPVTDLGKK